MTIDEREAFITKEAFRQHSSERGWSIAMCRFYAEFLCNVLYGSEHAQPPKGILGRSPVSEAAQDLTRKRLRPRPWRRRR